MLDNYVSVIQIKCIRSLKEGQKNDMCFEMHHYFTKICSAFGQGRRWGWERRQRN